MCLLSACLYNSCAYFVTDLGTEVGFHYNAAIDPYLCHIYIHNSQKTQFQFVLLKDLLCF